VVGGWVLAFLERAFAAREVFETRQGVCRLMPPRSLAEMSPRLATLAAPVVEQVAQRLATGQGNVAQPLRVPTLLTQANRSAGREKVRTTARRTKQPEKLEAPSACRGCGVILADAARQYCDECRHEVQAAQVAEFSAAGRAKLAALRAAGNDPSRGGQAGQKRATTTSKRKAELAA
jgi:hypothetical protein